MSEDEFPAGTLVRHIGYNAADLFNPVGENSLYGLLMRSMAEPLFPVWLQIYSLRPTNVGGQATYPGYRRYGRVIRGSINALERAYAKTLKGDTGTQEAMPAGRTRAKVKTVEVTMSMANRSRRPEFCIVLLSFTSFQSGITEHALALVNSEK